VTEGFEYARDLHAQFADADAYTVTEDAIEAFALALEGGWRNAVLSNHVPELPDLVQALGLDTYFAATFTSARIGYEKPNPAAFTTALTCLGDPSDRWMIGDKIDVDVRGAQLVGIPAILIGPWRPDERVEHADTLLAAVSLIIAAPSRHQRT